jgi:NADH-quinone oxidoreductase subunit G
MVTIHVDGRTHEVPEGNNLLQTVLDLGYDLPYFCWHPALGSVGACRQCAVKQFRDENDRNGMIVMACMTPVGDGLRISITDPEAVRFRASVIGWLMTNHPHDCPVCDEGGECHLQDMTVMTGHNTRSFRFNKRTYRNQNLGPFLNHEMNRCIHCYRCVRFYRDYAGGKDFNVFGSRNRTYFGRVADGTLESPFSGNLAEICPTGVFTDKTEKAHYTRKWDLQTAPSLCTLCGLGCNTLPGERLGQLRRIRNRYHGEINRYFLCDRGRFGYEFVNSPRRIRQPVLRRPGDPGSELVSAERAIDHVAGLLAGGATIGIGSPTASLEANHALRSLVGAENFFVGIDHGEAELLRTAVAILKEGPARPPSLREIECADAVLILGEDLTNTAPMLDLAVRQSLLNAPLERARDLKIPDWNDAVNRLMVNGERGPLFVATPGPTALDELASQVCRAAPQDIAHLGFAIAAIIDHDAPVPGDLPTAIARLIGPAAAALRTSKRPVVIAGMGSGSSSTLKAAASLVRALATTNPDAALCLVVPDCNSVGVGLLGAPDLSRAAPAAARGEIATAIVLEPDFSRRGRKAALSTILESVPHVVVLDHLEGAAADRAELVLPAATFAESGGTLVNNESRAQRFFQVFVPEGEVRASWRWLQQIGERVHGPGAFTWSGSDDVARALAEEIPIFGPVAALMPTLNHEPIRRVPRQSHRVTGRTSVNAHRQIREPRPPDDGESPLAYSMEGSPLPPPAGLITRYWSPGWNSVQALNRFQEEIGGALRGGDPGIRLIEPQPSDGTSPLHDAPERFTPRPDEWLIVPLYHLFGSERLSLETAGVAEQAPGPYVALSPDDGDRLGAADGDTVVVEIDGRPIELPLRSEPGLPQGCAGLPEGLPGLSDLPAGRWARLRRLP